MNKGINELFDGGAPIDEEITKDIDAGCVGWIVLPCFKNAVKDNGEISLVCGDIASWLFEHIFVYLWTGKVHLYRKE